jgi:hypothetical protein
MMFTGRACNDGYGAEWCSFGVSGDMGEVLGFATKKVGFFLGRGLTSTKPPLEERRCSALRCAGGVPSPSWGCGGRGSGRTIRRPDPVDTGRFVAP